MDRRIKAVGLVLGRMFGLVAASRGATACHVSGCRRLNLVVVAANGLTHTALCGAHVRQWVESQACQRVAANLSGKADLTLGSWARAVATRTEVLDLFRASPTRAST